MGTEIKRRTTEGVESNEIRKSNKCKARSTFSAYYGGKDFEDERGAMAMRMHEDGDRAMTIKR